MSDSLSFSIARRWIAAASSAPCARWRWIRAARRAPRRPAHPHRRQARAAHSAARQARDGYDSVRVEIRPAPAGHRRWPGPAQLPRCAPSSPARNRASRTRLRRSTPATQATTTSATRPHPLSPDGPASRFTGPDVGCLRAGLYGRARKLLVQAAEGCPRLLLYRLPGRDAGLADQADAPAGPDAAGGEFRRR